jgi:hypothetical protein
LAVIFNASVYGREGESCRLHETRQANVGVSGVERLELRVSFAEASQTLPQVFDLQLEALPKHVRPSLLDAVGRPRRFQNSR